LKVKLLFESAAISAVFVVLMSTAVFAGYPGPDYDTDTTFGDHGNWVVSAVAGYYYGPSYYGSEEFYSVRENGYTEYASPMYYCWFIDEDYYYGSCPGEYLHNEANELCTLVASYTVSYFKYYDVVKPLEALACRQIY
jgi:hypothetical protein